MQISFTEEQQAVIDARDCNVLVSAAAGSGKTAVLVERIIQLICSDLDVDHLLVVTFTKAAASQMKEKITAAIQKRLSLEPDNTHLQRQETLIHNAQITTIDSFCQYVIRNDFSAIGLDPSFRVGDEGELKLIREDVMSELLEKEYEASEENPDSDFLFCMEYFGTGSRDKKVEGYIEQLYNFSMSMPFPEDWIRERAGDYSIGDTAFDELPWVRECVESARRTIGECIEKADIAISVCNEPDGPYMYGDTLEADKASVSAALRYDSYDALFDGIRGISFGRLPSKKDDSVNTDKREYVKTLRQEVKDAIDELREKYFALTAGTVVKQMKLCDRAIKELCRLTLKYKESFDEKKRSLQLIDFSDMEHFALQILVDHPSESECVGKSAAQVLDACTPSATALEYRDYYREVLIDEYQDSNNVQEMILKAISGEKAAASERFMVGDVKQSIYKFRLARPEIFMEKLGSYDRSFDAKDRRIDLHKNFRSRSQVLDITNYIFKKIMGRDLGGVDYDRDAELVCGASYDEPVFDVTPELMMLDGKDVLQNGEEDEYLEGLTDREKEALMIAQRIHQLRAENKNLMYKDIVILLRSLSGWDNVFKDVLEDQGIPTYIDSKSGYFDSPEVAVLLNMLSVIDNPTRDIPLVSVMHSSLGGFTDEELALIRIKLNEAEEETLSDSLYEGMRGMAGAFGELDEKVATFVRMVEDFRDLSTYTPVHELLQLVIDRTGFDMIVTAQPSGNQKRANIEMLLERAASFEKTSFKGLFHFVRYIEHIRVVQVDYGEAGTIDENADVVRIMSIHKSKGLEFPVVFVSGLTKEFNKMDLRGDLVCDMDLGIGARCIDFKLRVKYDTLKRRIITDKMNNDNLGEEIRVLYVALTRAKEKLILTAFVGDLLKTLAGELRKLPLMAGEKGEKRAVAQGEEEQAGSIASKANDESRKKELLPFSLRHGSAGYFSLVLRALLPHPAMRSVLEKYKLDEALFDKYESPGPELRVTAIGDKELKENLIERGVHGLLRREELRSALERVTSSDEKNARSDVPYEAETAPPNTPYDAKPTTPDTPYDAKTSFSDTFIDAVTPPSDTFYDAELADRLHARFSSKYAYENLKGLFTKTSVSELKKKAYEEEETEAVKAEFVLDAEKEAVKAEFEPGAEYETKAPGAGKPDSERSDDMVPETVMNPDIAEMDRPKAAQTKAFKGDSANVRKHYTGADKGTAYHRVMELLDDEIYGDADLMKGAGKEPGVSAFIRDWIKRKSADGLMDPDTPQMVWTPDVTAFLESDLGQRMGRAFRDGTLMREKPFMMGISASELDPKFPEEEMVLIQGIIDAFFVEDGEVVLVDYKTDRVSDGDMLVRRYKKQIELYRRAIEAATGCKVKESYLYSVALKQAVEIQVF